MRIRIAGAMLLASGFLLVTPGAAVAATGVILYGGVGGHDAGDSDNIGALVIVDQHNATFTVVGSPIPGTRLSGVAFDSTGALYASTSGTGGTPITSTLIRIDPDTGALIAVVGPITNGPGGPPMSIADLAVQPGTDRLFAVKAPIDLQGGGGRLYTIDKATAVATFVGNTAPSSSRATLAFAPDGTLYESAFRTHPPALYTLNPATGAVLSSVPTVDFYGALAVRPTDGVLFGGNGDEGEIFNLDPATGAATLLGNTSPTFLGGLGFRTCSIDLAGVAADPSVLWPPNHKLVNVTVDYTATGSCGTAAPVSCSLDVASNEGNGADWTVVDDHHVQLRAERVGNGSGRTYTVTLTCTDTAGSSSTAAVTVAVPHDQGH
ncbi:MAG TPA: hypothetical protein VFE33_30865 [Thermoanaerobaculia bacterium]|nr:hypothetical protein [Thermoanaerobaculia bacterium]